MIPIFSQLDYNISRFVMIPRVDQVSHVTRVFDKAGISCFHIEDMGNGYMKIVASYYFDEPVNIKAIRANFF